MRLRTVSRELPPVAAVGFGDVSLAVAQARGIDHRDLARAIDDALSLGISLFTIAADEDSEKLVGAAIRTANLRDRVIASTFVELDRRLDPRGTQLAVERSLRATKLDVLPLVRMPLTLDATRAKPWPEFAAGMMRLVREGKVIAWSAIPDDTFVFEEPSPDDAPAVEVAFTAAAPTPVSASGLLMPSGDELQALIAMTAANGPTMVSLSDLNAGLAGFAAPSSTGRRAAPSPIGAPFALHVVTDSLCDRRAVLPPGPILVERPLAGGVLGGTIGPVLAKTDDRFGLDLAALGARLLGLAQLVEDVPPMLRAHLGAGAPFARVDDPIDRTVGALALRYVLDRGGDRAVVLPRLHRRAHLAEAIAVASAAPLSERDRARIEAAIEAIEVPSA